MTAAPGIWTPLAVNYFRNPKVAAAPPRARLLHLAGLCYCQEHVTDGAIPASVLPILVAESGANRNSSDALIDAGLWRKTDDGWEVCGWDEWNRPATEVAGIRAKKRDAGGLGNHVRWHEGRGVTDPGCRWCDDSAIADSRSGESPPTPTPTPIAPLPPTVDNSLRRRVVAAAAAAEAKKAGKAGHGGYVAAIRERLRSDADGRLEQAVTSWPDAPVDKLAAFVLGEDVRGLEMYR